MENVRSSEEWLEIFRKADEAVANGMSVKEWLDRQGINRGSYYSARRKAANLGHVSYRSNKPNAKPDPAKLQKKPTRRKPERVEPSLVSLSVPKEAARPPGMESPGFGFVMITDYRTALSILKETRV